MKLTNFIFRKSPLLLLIFSLLTVGCGDDDGGSTNSSAKGYLTCKINGTDYDFSQQVNANDPPSEEIIHFVTIGGHLTDDFKSPGFGFQLVSEEGAVQGETYTSADSELHGNYYIQNLDDNGNIIGTTVYTGDGSDGSGFTMTITTLADWGVEGTFSGVLRNSESGEFLTVTDGKFSARYNYQD